MAITLLPSQATDPELPSVIARCGLPAEQFRVSVPAGLATGASVAGNLARLADVATGPVFPLPPNFTLPAVT